METPKININIEDAPWQACECGGMVFEEKLMVKKISALLSPTGKEANVPFPACVCVACGKIPAFIHSKLPAIPESYKAKKPINLL